MEKNIYIIFINKTWKKKFDFRTQKQSFIHKWRVGNEVSFLIMEIFFLILNSFIYLMMMMMILIIAMVATSFKDIISLHKKNCNLYIDLNLIDWSIDWLTDWLMDGLQVATQNKHTQLSINQWRRKKNHHHSLFIKQGMDENFTH